MKDCCSYNNGAYDLAVIGAGSAGFSAAITAAEAGARVALIGSGTIGGTCVNVGCVPSKALIRAVETLHNARAASRFDGIEAEARVTDWAATVAQKQSLVDELRGAKYIDVLPRHENVTYIEGLARFSDEGKLTVDGAPFAVGKVIIATGSRAHVPPIPGIEGVETLDSTSALELTALPASMLVLGAGYIGVELAQIFARAGVEVTLISRRGVLPGAEPEISRELERQLSHEGIRLHRTRSYERVSQDGQGVCLTVTDGEELRGERLLLATGRLPNVEGLNLGAAGIKTDARGGIEVNAQMRTANSTIWAAGDVTGRDQFVYMAAYGAKIAARSAMGNEGRGYDNGAMPWVVFSDPQVAGVGLSEQEAIDQGHEVVTSVLPLDAVPRALAARDTRGLIKLVAEAETKRLLGAQILAPEGADSIQTAAMAIKAGMTYEELGDTIMPYLTTVEGLKLAAQTFEKDVAALSCCAG
ncbi:mercury(II) reductase [Brevirhabdus pacifica]|uniref:Mercuric reductase n=1 Tax=Brevirhabdus pacifica TaxID=1267768 RepID=A0A1U7DGP7_9RHOB|nr:mercury(II) reductase [Brevirhabdus pacifica]APX89174.1 mercury(II) reductase [Brevirhabdus pacifica]OWU76770.1 mercuric reductase [Loktanella sp. 22II-4b]PJJ86231.1 mercuric reductase [Brevirhabdus pacifica]